MKDENGNTYFKEYWDNPPPPLTAMQRFAANVEGDRRRKAYIEKHPRDEKPNLAPVGWGEPMKPKKRRRRK